MTHCFVCFGGREEVVKVLWHIHTKSVAVGETTNPPSFTYRWKSQGSWEIADLPSLIHPVLACHIHLIQYLCFHLCLNYFPGS